MSEHARRYEAAVHGMQTGVAMLMDKNSECTPKHLRVGVNCALVDSAALAGLLIEKGVITEEEYLRALADVMERERATYEKRVRHELGNDSIFLH